MSRWNHDLITLHQEFDKIRYGVMADIAAFHAAARGSIPCIGTFSKSVSLENICQLFWQM